MVNKTELSWFCVQKTKTTERKKERKRESEVAQSCLTFCDPMHWSLPGSSVRGILQARILEWVAISFSRGSSRSRDQTQVSTLQADALTSEPPGKPQNPPPLRPAKNANLFGKNNLYLIVTNKTYLFFMFLSIDYLFLTFLPLSFPLSS